jgi:hypothetical protein
VIRERAGTIPSRTTVYAGSGRLDARLPMDKKTSKDATPVPAEAPSNAKEEAPPVNGKPAGIRTASEEQFKKAQRKTSAQHAGLFRRLAK